MFMSSVVAFPHLHLHLAHRPDDALSSQMIRGEVQEEKLPSGVTRLVSRKCPPLPEQELRAVGLRIGRRLMSSTPQQ